MELKTLFSPKKIGNVQIKNRIVRSATFMHIAEKYGYIGDRYLKVYDELAKGGTGLIITGAVAVDPTGTGGPYQVCLYDDSHMEGHKKLVDTIHNNDDTKVAVQIQHIGRLGVHPKYPTVAPSPVTYKVTGITPRELTTEEVKEYIKSGEPLDAAGAYKIQEMGGKFIKRIEGCYYNVVGLPLATLIEMLRKFKVEI